VTSDEPPYEEDEQAEGELLARALAGAERAPREVGDALDAADVVRVLRAPVLSEERLNAVLADGELRVAQTRKRSRRRIAVLGSATGALALAAAALLMVRAPQHEPSSKAVAPAAAPAASPRAEVPSGPSAAAKAPPEAPVGGAASAEQTLRQAQIAWLKMATDETRAQLDRALVTYRDEQLAQLEQRYGR
jgi:hypothetical protein